jgi:hypothetical protein
LFFFYPTQPKNVLPKKEEVNKDYTNTKKQQARKKSETKMKE